jgi:DNA-directed RNA polymerase subunit L
MNKTKKSKSDANPKIKDLYIQDVLFTLDNPAFNNLKNKKEVLELLPNKTTQKISFVVKNVHTSVANAIRQVTIMELPVKVLDFNVECISTNDKEIILAELKDRISFIPINQDIPQDIVFSLNASNNDIKQDYMVIRSEKIVQTGGKILTSLPFAKTFRLLKLRPGRVITIPNINIIEGMGYTHSKFSLTSEFKFQVRDYIDIEYLNEKGNIVRKIVKRSDLIDALIKEKISHPLTEEKSNIVNRTLYNWKILLIPDQSYLNVVSKQTLARVQSYDVLLEDIDIQGYSSLETDPKEYFLEFTMYGNVNPQQTMQDVCDNIIKRLQNLLDLENLVIKADSEKTKILIRGEDHVIGNLLKRAIFDLDPSIGLINSTLEHPEIRVVTINIRHPTPTKIFLDAAKKLIDLFEDLKTQFVNK